MRRPRATPARVLVVVAWALVGCASQADGGPSSGDGGAGASDGPRVTLGTGREAFEELGAEGRVPLIKGIQGGFHVWTSFLAYGFDTDVLRMELSTRWEELDGSVVPVAGNVSVKPATDPAGMPALLSLGWPAGIFNPVCANGRRIGIELTVRDTSAGASASDSASWIVDVAEEDRASDCAP